ncbi:MAG: glycosyltransferase family 2 protein [Lachnospiraceae bacterium]|nr:glycosyltransferase family 2 protein [Lachnospiraceae bacterium]
MEERILTVLTPTYNRADKLPALYYSLTEQTDRRFVWFVVDDGSADDTEAVIGKLAKESPFPIRYERKENGGKHTALNLAIPEIRTPLTMIVDSDDALTKDAVAVIAEYHGHYDSRAEELKLCGYSFLRADRNGTVNGGRYPEEDAVGSVRDKRINAGLWGDKAEVYRTEILKQYPFPVFEGERFYPEDAVWLQMSGPYNLVHANRIIYVCEYLEGGLTRTGRRMKIYSPCGMMARSAVYLGDPGVALKVKAKMLLLYRIYERFYGTGRPLPDLCRIRRGVLYHLCALPSLLFFTRWKKDA